MRDPTQCCEEGEKITPSVLLMKVTFVSDMVTALWAQRGGSEGVAQGTRAGQSSAEGLGKDYSSIARG